jgi:hypothetical protein
MAILATEKVLTLDYWKLAQNLQVGDYVFDKEGKLQKVTLVQEYRSDACYRAHFNDHMTIAGDQHLGFQVEDKLYRDRLLQYKGKFKFKRPLRFKKISELAETNLKRNNWAHIYSIPTTKPLQFPHQTLPVPPFIFGFWYFNRQSTKRMHPPRGQKEYIYQKFKDAGYAIREHAKHQSTGERYFSVTPTIESHLGFDIPHRIPNNYLLASAEQRLELLRGIMHAKSKQYSKPKDTFRFASNHLPSLLQVQSLVESLGHKTTLEANDFRGTYRLYFRTRLQLTPDQAVNPKPIVHNGRRYIKRIEKIAPQLCVHIETEGADNSFLVGEGFIAVC